MSRYLMMFCCLLFCFAIHAQESQKQINEIKKNKRYVYAVATSSNTKEEAAQNAKDLLMLEVEQWLKDENKNDFTGYVVKVKNNTQQIETQRGKLYRVFAYVAKKDILPYYADEEIETAKVDAVAVAVPAASTVVPIPTAEQTNVLDVKFTAEEEQMLKINKFDDINSYVAEQKAKGTIADCGKYVTLPKDADVYLFVYNPQGDVCAKIKKFGAESFNMTTLQKDDVASYKGCGAIWIKMKE